MALVLGSALCSDAAAALPGEWLITNGLGGYGCGTVAGPPTRSYHGLLIAARRPPLDRVLLLAGVSETLLLPSGPVELASLRWEGGRHEPLGHRWIQQFRLEGTVPCWRYGIGDLLLEKRIWMQPGAHATWLRYRLLQSSGPVVLRLVLGVHHRSPHGGLERPDLVVEPCGEGASVGLADQPPALHLRSDRGVVRPLQTPCWSGPLHLAQEAERGLLAQSEQLWAAELEVELSEGSAAVSVLASCEPVEGPLDGRRALAQQRSHGREVLRCWQRAQPRLARLAPGWVRQLVLAADQFVVQRPLPAGGKGFSMIAGYPWFGDWGRDTFISLAGLTLDTGRPEIAAGILRTYAAHLKDGLLPNLFPDDPAELAAGRGYNTVDATLWFVQALDQHRRATGRDALIAELFPLLEAIVACHRRGTRFAIAMDPADGLLSAGLGQSEALTWMDACPGGVAVTPRQGKPVEVNALWVNALRCVARFAAALGRDPAPWAQLADQAAASFQRFWNSERGCCFDVIDGPGGAVDASLRPNQLLALSLPEPLLSLEQARSILEVCGRELLTSHGLRTLEPSDPRYCGHYGGGVLERDGAYHQGTVWAWWLGPYVEAWLRIGGDRSAGLRLLQPLADHLQEAGLGSVSEIFDGDAPFAPRGCFAQAWSVAALLRGWVAVMGPRQELLAE